jgi:regulatory protein YycH of two-component signal transduction system YycFG
LYTRIILHDGNEIYEIVDMDNKNDYSRDLFEQTINSIKFFD